jgi:hypothetical protein
MDKLLYILTGNNAEWEDIIIYDNETDAINASIKYPNLRVEIFKQKIDAVGYTPTYTYYENGLIQL